MNKINIVFCADDKHVKQLALVIFSIIRNFRNPEAILIFYVLNSDISICNQKKLRHRFEKYKSVEISFLYVDDRVFNNFPLNIAHVSRVTYYRFLIADLLPDESKALYLDLDTLVLKDISNLYNINIDKYYIAGSNKNYFTSEFPGYKTMIGLSENSTYINAGVILFNLSMIQRDGMTQKLFENTLKKKDVIRIQDQDIINITFAGKIKDFDCKYNYTTSDRRGHSRNNEDIIIVHFNTANKPWLDNYVEDHDSSYFAKKYREYLEKMESTKE